MNLIIKHAIFWLAIIIVFMAIRYCFEEYGLKEKFKHSSACFAESRLLLNQIYPLDMVKLFKNTCNNLTETDPKAIKKAFIVAYKIERKY